jgi:hypothetical protein
MIRNRNLASSSSQVLAENDFLTYSGPGFVGTPYQGTSDSIFYYNTFGYVTYLTSTLCPVNQCSNHYYDPAASDTAIEGYPEYEQITYLVTRDFSRDNYWYITDLRGQMY